MQSDPRRQRQEYHLGILSAALGTFFSDMCSISRSDSSTALIGHNREEPTQSVSGPCFSRSDGHEIFRRSHCGLASNPKTLGSSNLRPNNKINVQIARC